MPTTVSPSPRERSAKRIDPLLAHVPQQDQEDRAEETADARRGRVLEARLCRRASWAVRPAERRVIRGVERSSTLSFSRSSAIGASTLSRYCSSLRIISTSIDELPNCSAFMALLVEVFGRRFLLGLEDLDAGLEFDDLGIQVSARLLQPCRQFFLPLRRLLDKSLLRPLVSAETFENSGSLSFS